MFPPPLYEDIILTHAKHRQNFRVLKNPTITIEKANPVCGDRIILQVLLNGDIIYDIAFQGSGCAISQASASLLTTKIKGQHLSDAATLGLRVREMMTTSVDIDDPGLGELRALEKVRKYPVRRKCALLAWDALSESLESIKQSAK